jgi:hypothetical protein
VAAKKRRRPPPAKRAPAVVEGPVAPEPVAAPPRRTRAATSPATDAETRWSAAGLLALLGLAFLLQIPVGVITHTISPANPLIIDIFLFQPQYLVVACVLVMPLARRVTAQTRNLRLLESLSLGIMYALLSLIVGTVFVHPASASVSTDQFIKHLKLSDGLLLGVGDVLGLFGTAVLYPGFSRMLGAPARRARARMLERSAAGGRRPTATDRSSKRGSRPGR